MKDLKLNKKSLGGVVRTLTELVMSSDKIYRLQIKIWKDKRSLNQNALMHMWFGDISEFLIAHNRKDCTPAWVKEMLKYTFLGTELRTVTMINVVTGERSAKESYELIHTKSLDTGEMKRFLDQIYAWSVDTLRLPLTIPVDSEYKKLLEMEIG